MALVLTNKFEASTADVERRVGRPTMGDADVERDNYSNETRLTYGTPEDVISGVAGLYVAYADQDRWLNQGGESTFHDRKNQLGGLWRDELALCRSMDGDRRAALSA